MLDGVLRRHIDPVFDVFGRETGRLGISANAVTLAGAAAGFACALAVWLGWFWLALALFALNRFADGLDGAVARAGGITDRGGYLDIVCDFIVFGALPLAFALYHPERNALSAAVLLASFYANGTSFLAFSAIAAKRRMETTARGLKSLYFTTGLAEGTETIVFFAAVLLWPAWFPALAWPFAGLCLITCVARIMLAWRIFTVDDPR